MQQWKSSGSKTGHLRNSHLVQAKKNAWILLQGEMSVWHGNVWIWNESNTAVYLPPVSWTQTKIRSTHRSPGPEFQLIFSSYVPWGSRWVSSISNAYNGSEFKGLKLFCHCYAGLSLLKRILLKSRHPLNCLFLNQRCHAMHLRKCLIAMYEAKQTNKQKVIPTMSLVGGYSSDPHSRNVSKTFNCRKHCIPFGWALMSFLEKI